MFTPGSGEPETAAIFYPGMGPIRCVYACRILQTSPRFFATLHLRGIATAPRISFSSMRAEPKYRNWKSLVCRDVATGEVLFRMDPPEEGPRCVVFSRDGRLLAGALVV